MFDISKVEIKRSARGSISIAITPTGRVIVRAPHLIPKSFILSFVENKRDWIEKRLVLTNGTAKKPKKFADGEKFFYLGKEYDLKFGYFPQIGITGSNLIVPEALKNQAKSVLEKWYIKEAKLLIKDMVVEHSAKMNTSFKNITFSDTKSQWGRCTHDNRLQFNWRLVMAPLLVVRYVVIHELSHTKEKNHSQKFWSTVRSYNPSYKSQIKWLKENGGKLRF